MDKEITLGNVEIAKMMGIQPIKATCEHTNEEYYYYNNAELQCFEGLPDYSTEWGSLMPVVEKINERDWVTIKADECKIHSLWVGEFGDFLVVKEGRPLIESVYAAVLAYATWYNLNVGVE